MVLGLRCGFSTSGGLGHGDGLGQGDGVAVGSWLWVDSERDGGCLGFRSDLTMIRSRQRPLIYARPGEVQTGGT